jgi:hypothetical protein
MMEDKVMFTLTNDELLDSRLSHARFTELVNQHSTTVHEIKLSTNLNGEFMFITLAARIPQLHWCESTSAKRRRVTFWGLGYHDSHERWLCDEWRWSEACVFGLPSGAPKLSRRRVLAEINERRAFCLTEAQAAEPASSRAQLFAMLADLGDEDGATTMLEDMEMMGVDVDGFFDE